jgi:hypothetical protein
MSGPAGSKCSQYSRRSESISFSLPGTTKRGKPSGASAANAVDAIVTSRTSNRSFIMAI